MSLRFLKLLLSAAGLSITALVAAQDSGRELHVCADPDNMPYSDEEERGFENRIARLVAEDLGATLRYFWLPLRRGFVRKTIGEGLCDVFIGVPAGFERVMTTRPYYRSSYVFVFREGEAVADAFDSDQLRMRRVAVQLVGNDLAATPPGYALARAGAINNVTGYTIYGDGPAAQRMVADVATRKVDIALIWGPQAGYFARHAAVPVKVMVAHAPPGLPTPFEFSMAMGVRKGDRTLCDELNAVIERRRKDIDAILAEYAVPRTDAAAKETGR